MSIRYCWLVVLSSSSLFLLYYKSHLNLLMIKLLNLVLEIFKKYRFVGIFYYMRLKYLKLFFVAYRLYLSYLLQYLMWLWIEKVMLVKEQIPLHIGIIMDGNGRWAIEKGFRRSAGHEMGCDNLKSLATHIYQKGIKYLSIYAFSTDNFKRSSKEVDFLMNLFYFDDLFVLKTYFNFYSFYYLVI